MPPEIKLMMMMNDDIVSSERRD